jgi:CRP/FNR family transcriptional regulator, cyclic AMP receptor protein
MSEAEAAAALARHPFLQGVGAPLLSGLATLAELQRFDTGATIVREGDAARSFFLIVSGKVALVIVPHDRPHLTVLTLGPGEALGWSWLVPPHRWRIDARALKPTELLVLPAEALRLLLDAHPAEGYRFLLRLVPILAQRLDATRLQVLDVHGP